MSGQKVVVLRDRPYPIRRSTRRHRLPDWPITVSPDYLTRAGRDAGTLRIHAVRRVPADACADV